MSRIRPRVRASSTFLTALPQRLKQTKRQYIENLLSTKKQNFRFWFVYIQIVLPSVLQRGRDIFVDMSIARWRLSGWSRSYIWESSAYRWTEIYFRCTISFLIYSRTACNFVWQLWGLRLVEKLPNCPCLYQFSKHSCYGKKNANKRCLFTCDWVRYDTKISYHSVTR